MSSLKKNINLRHYFYKKFKSKYKFYNNLIFNDFKKSILKILLI